MTKKERERRFVRALRKEWRKEKKTAALEERIAQLEQWPTQVVAALLARAVTVCGPVNTRSS